MLSGLTLGNGTIFQITLIVRLVAAVVTPIADCDETFNYWEPMHYLVHHNGFQTWEYSPEFALRSYTYIWLHSGAVVVCDYLGFDKVTAFFATRALLGLISTICEVLFIRKIGERYGDDAKIICFAFLVSNAGMFLCSTAFLPSTTCMYIVMLMYSSWLSADFAGALSAGSFAVLLVWPFSALAFVPVGVEAVYQKGAVWVALVACTCFLAFFVAPSALDSFAHYNTTVAPIGNLVLYNVFGSDGANLYGTEPWYFYFQNLFLNLNLVSVLGFASLVLVLLTFKLSWVSGAGKDGAKSVSLSTIMYLTPMLLVFSQFTSMAHKEERFLSMLYPIFCFSGCIALIRLEAIGLWISSKASCGSSMVNGVLSKFVRILKWFVVALSVVISASRITAIVLGYSAPVQLFAEMAKSQDLKGVLCIGKEWYRFPTTFLLHDGLQVQWIEAGFHGLLPQQYGQYPEGLSAIPGGLNDQNKENEAVYVPLEQCDYVVDFEERQNPKGNVASAGNWIEVSCHQFLNADLSNSPWRSFHIPEWARPSSAKVIHDPYCLYRKSNTP